MRVLVCGGREFDDKRRLFAALDEFDEECGITVLIQGDAKGADKLAAEWAKKHDIKVETYPADWRKFGKRAGWIRNNQMIAEGKPEVVVAFSGGVGTQMMKHLAEAARLHVVLG